jgi:hypothetical protein
MSTIKSSRSSERGIWFGLSHGGATALQSLRHLRATDRRVRLTSLYAVQVQQDWLRRDDL